MPSTPVAVLRSLLTLALTALLLATGASSRAAEDFLPPEQAFKVSARSAGDVAVEISFDVAPGYYLYREPFRVLAEGAQAGPLQIPGGKVKFDETFQKNVETYRGRVNLQVPVLQAEGPFRLTIVSQGCADQGLCYPPMASVISASLKGLAGDGQVRVVSTGDLPPPGGVGPLPSVSTALGTEARATAVLGASPGAPSSEGVASVISRAVEIAPAAPTDSARIDAVLSTGRFWAVIGVFFVAGLLLSFTPCVLPMLPILSSIIAGTEEHPSRTRALILAGSYSLGMALVYTGLGIAAGLAGEGMAAWLQTPWVLVLFALLLVLFALSMFDVYELRLPAAFTAHVSGASQRLPAGRALGVFVMGGLSALIVSPCITAPLAGALVFLGQTRDVVLGGSALFALSAGMSVPLLLLGASAGAWLPRSGGWMHTVKRFFGVLLLGVALWVVQPALPASMGLLLWGLLLLIAGFMLRPFDAHPHAGTPRVWLQRALGVTALVLGVLQIVGAASGARDPLQPLASLGGAARPAIASEGLIFRTVADVTELDAALRDAHRPVMLDFYADWCVSCKEMERFTFADPLVRERLNKALLLKADVTRNTEQDRELLRRFSLFGPPGTLFFDLAGQERRDVRVIGFQNSTRFLQTLDAAGL